MTRLEQLEEFLRDDPNDPFNIYALALEYDKSDRVKSGELFESLLMNHADYLPTYYHAAIHFESLGQTGKATLILEKGITLATQQGEQKTKRELQSLLGEFE